MTKSLLAKIAICISICLFIGFLSGFATASSIRDWYVELNKPSLNPPNWIFGPVWTILYALMGVSVGLIWHKGFEKPAVKSAIYIFIAQIMLNALWSILFFGMKNPQLALIEIIILWALILLTIIKFKPIDSRAAYLLVPYLLWVSFATYLNFSIWSLN